MTEDRRYLKRAIELAGMSPEVIGCGVVIVQSDKVLAETYNSQKTDNIAVNHAEIKAIMTANKLLKSRKLENATAYCSCEPCAMCLVALSYAKISRIVFYKTMKDIFPEDPQSALDAYEFIKGLNFTPQLEQIELA